MLLNRGGAVTRSSTSSGIQLRLKLLNEYLQPDILLDQKLIMVSEMIKQAFQVLRRRHCEPGERKHSQETETHKSNNF